MTINLPTIIEAGRSKELHRSDHQYLHMVSASIYPVTWWGARGDGITDDTNAIQTAINTAEGKIIYFPPGIYLVSALTFPSNVWLDGSGITSTLRLQDNINKAVLRNSNVVDGNINIKISNLTIDGNSFHQSINVGHGIQLLYVNNVTIEHCVFKECGKDGIYLGMGGSFEGQVVGGDNNNVFIHHCQFYRPRRNGISITRGVHITIQDCLFDECNIGTLEDSVYDAGSIDLEPNRTTDIVEYINIINNSITRPYRRGIQMAANATNFGPILIVNNNIESSYHGICSFSPTIHELQIVHNHVKVTGVAAAGVVISGGGKHLQIQENYIQSEGPGISLTNGAERGVITGNVIHGASVGIVTASAVGNCACIHIADNACIECIEPISIGNATNVTTADNVVW